MEKIDILQKILLEVKAQLTILDCKIDNLEAKIDELSSLKEKTSTAVLSDTDSQTTKEENTSEYHNTDLEEPEQNDDLNLGGEPDNDPIEKTDDEIAAEINAEKSDIFINGQIDNDKLFEALKIESEKKKEATTKTIETVEEIKKIQQSVKQFSDLTYDITKHLNM